MKGHRFIFFLVASSGNVARWEAEFHEQGIARMRSNVQRELSGDDQKEFDRMANMIKIEYSDP